MLIFDWHLFLLIWQRQRVYNSNFCNQKPIKNISIFFIVISDHFDEISESEAIEETTPREVVSYQRFGRDSKCIPKLFRCHLCGFSCRYKTTLLKHFNTHPNWANISGKKRIHRHCSCSQCGNEKLCIFACWRPSPNERK